MNDPNYYAEEYNSIGKEFKKIRILDSTLREGEQHPGVSFTVKQRIQIAWELDYFGVDQIEISPIISTDHAEATKTIIKQGLKADIVAHGRALKEDIDVSRKCDASWVAAYLGISDIHLKDKLRISRDEALNRAVKTVEYAKSRGLQVEFSAEDATRTDRDFLKKIFTAVTKAGADRIDIPDTVGYSTPQYIAEITKDAIEATKLPISMHCHNDFGLAVANAISGIQAGAQCAHVTINGIGERAGNASLEELVMALQCLRFDQSWETSIKTELLYETSKYVSKLAGMPVQPNKAIIGENAFGHESGIHTHGVLSNPLTYEPISPEIVGRNRWFQVGKHAGTHGINSMLEDYGVQPDKDQLKQILEKVKSIGDQGNHVTDVEFCQYPMK